MVLWTIKDALSPDLQPGDGDQPPSSSVGVKKNYENPLVLSFENQMTKSEVFIFFFFKYPQGSVSI